LDEITMDTRVLMFAFALSILSGLIFGLLPVFKFARRRASSGGLREGGRNASAGRERHRARSVLVVAQVAMALVLLVSSGLMMRTLQALRHIDPGFTNPEQVQTLRVSIPEATVQDDNRVARIHHDILERIADIPGVTSVGASSSVTMDNWNSNDPIMVEDQPVAEGKLPPLRRFKFVAPGYFQTMGNHLVAGRDLTWTDIFDKRKYLLLSENIAREYWQDPAKAIGKRVRLTPVAPWREVIGVVGNDYDDGVDQKATPTVYWPLLASDFWDLPTRVERAPVYVIRSTRAGTTALRKDIEQAVWSINRDLPLANVRTLGEIYNRSMARTSFTLILLGLASGMALLLGVVGIYGVLSYAVTQRTREIGIRIALGASAATVRTMFVRHGLALAATGAVIGICTAALLTRLIKALLFGVSPLDPVTYASVAIVLTASALLASYIPALRATTIEPVEALRSE
jgi:putative ABC transport system permease protein